MYYFFAEKFRVWTKDLKKAEKESRPPVHICLLLPTAGGVLLVGDAAAHVGVLRESIIYEDRSQGVRSLAKLATHEFEVACFAHGRPVRRAASARFRARWGDTARFAP